MKKIRDVLRLTFEFGMSRPAEGQRGDRHRPVAITDRQDVGLDQRQLERLHVVGRRRLRLRLQERGKALAA